MRLFLFILVPWTLVQAQTRLPEKLGAAPVLLSVGAKEMDALRARHRGKVLVLNFWATWCLPCKEEFPDLVKLKNRYANDGVSVVFVSIDEDDETTRRKAIDFLRKERAPSPSYIKTSGDDETFINAVHPKWTGAVPATFIYDRKGTLVAMTVEQTNFSELERTLRPLLR